MNRRRPCSRCCPGKSASSHVWSGSPWAPETWSSPTARWPRRRSLEDLGRAHGARGQNGDAVRAFEQALELYQTTAAAWDGRRVRGRLRALGVQRRSTSAERPQQGWAALTDSELEVARLVAAGLTNAKAAEQLFVSPHTIGTHLRHIFAKLDVNSRVELTRIALQRESGD